MTVLSPVIPHFASECISEIQKKDGVSWPIANKKILGSKTHKIVIQINGKKRGILSSDKIMDEYQLIDVIKLDKEYINYFKDKTIIKTIYVKDRLINLILK